MSEIEGYPITEIELNLLGTKNVFLDLLMLFFGFGIPSFLNASHLYNLYSEGTYSNLTIVLVNFGVGGLGIFLGLIFSIIALIISRKNSRFINVIKGRKAQKFKPWFDKNQNILRENKNNNFYKSFLINYINEN